jgi:CheY-like chemotaxis protein
MTIGQVENELGLSRRQLQRETLKGLEALASILWTNHEIETLSISEQTSGVLLPDMENDIKQLETELNQWKLAWQVCELSTLINDVLWLLKPALDQGQAEVQVDIPDTLAPVFVDTTLARQALFMIMRLMVQNTHGIITLTATQEDKFMNIQVHSPSCFNNPHEDDWPMAQMIIHELGGSLSIESNSKIGFQLNIYLQLVGQKRVLVIDDNLAILQLFERYLAPHHYEVIKAVSGAEALMLLSESRPDVIILDVMMPNIDGWQVLRSLKQNPITTSTPVIICSVLKEPQLALSLGAQAYLKKPVDRLALLATLEQLLSHLPPAGAKHPQEPLNN